MSDEEVIEILRNFKDFLTIGDFVSDAFRFIGWTLVMGLSYLVDGMESVTNQMLLVKGFFENPEVIAFTESIRPMLFILLAFSLLFSGYLLIFQRKIQAETVAINLIIAISIIVLLQEGMGKVNDFTDESVTVVNNGQLFGTEDGTISENILSRNIQDVVEFDQSNFESTDFVQSIPYDMSKSLVVTEKLKGDEGVTLENEKVFENYVTRSADGEPVLTELDQGGLITVTNQFYYRYSIDWLTIIVTLAVMGFTLFSIAYKLARLSFELVFNQLLVTILAPIDIHDGQKTKKVLQNIINIFIVIILIFLSMKIYVIGTAFLENNFDGLVYLIALIGFSVALIDGPNIVERLFGIDAGLKNGWGLAAGGYAAYKALRGGAGLASKAGDSSGDKKTGKDGGKKAQGEGNQEDGSSTNGLGNQSPLANTQQKSPFGGLGINTGTGVNGVALAGVGNAGLAGKGDNKDQEPLTTGKEDLSQAGNKDSLENRGNSKEAKGGKNNGSPSSINDISQNGESSDSITGEGTKQSPTDKARNEGFKQGMNKTIDELTQDTKNRQTAKAGSKEGSPTASTSPVTSEGSKEQQTMNRNRQAGRQVNANDSIDQNQQGSTNSQTTQSGASESTSYANPSSTPEMQGASEGTSEQQTVNRNHQAARQVNANDSINESQQQGSTNSQTTQSGGNAGSSSSQSTGTGQAQGSSESVNGQQTVNRSRQGVQQVNVNDSVNQTQQGSTNSQTTQSGGNVGSSSSRPTSAAQVQDSSESVNGQQTVNRSRQGVQQVNVNDSVNQTQQVTTNSQTTQSGGSRSGSTSGTKSAPSTQSKSERTVEQQTVNNHRQNVSQVNQNNIHENLTETRQHTLNKTSKLNKFSRMKTIGKQKDNEE